ACLDTCAVADLDVVRLPSGQGEDHAVRRETASVWFVADLLPHAVVDCQGAVQVAGGSGIERYFPEAGSWRYELKEIEILGIVNGSALTPGGRRRQRERVGRLKRIAEIIGQERELQAIGTGRILGGATGSRLHVIG